VYLWDQDDGFAGIVLMKKCTSTSPLPFYLHLLPTSLPVFHHTNTPSSLLALNPSTPSTSTWDSIHVFEATEPSRPTSPTHYKLTSTILLSLSSASPALGTISLAGNLTRQAEADVVAKDDAQHVANIGKLVEDMEGRMRGGMEVVYFGKTRDVVGDLRSKYQCSVRERERG